MAQAHDNRWDAARHGAAGAAGLPAGSAADIRKGWKRAQLPDWRPGGDWKNKPDAKRQKKVCLHRMITFKGLEASDKEWLSGARQVCRVGC